MKIPGLRHVKGLIVEILGWLLVAAGIAALILPGPGLLMLFIGLVLLATRYEWAERRVEPVKKAAEKAARQSVSSWWNIFISLAGAAIIAGVGVVWGVRPAVPDWWPLRDRLWLPGGWGTGGTLIASSLIAVGLLIYSFRTYRGPKP